MGPWALGVPIVLVSCVGLLLNAYILLVVVGLGKQIHQQQSANTLLLIHLGAVEAAVCLVLLIFSTGSWPIAGTWCVLHGFLLALLHPVALWTVTGLNCERYYAIAAPLHYAALVSPRRVIFGLAASWTGSLLLCLPPISGLAPPYTYIPGLGCCAPDFGNDSWGSSAALYGVVYTLLGLALPAVVVTVCNFRVLGIARYHRHRIASAIYEVTLSAQVTITHQRNPFFIPSVTSPNAGGPPRFHSAASTVMQLVGSLYLLYFPYCGLVLWEACCAIGLGEIGTQRLHAHPRFASLASLLLACSPPVNGLLYGLKSRTLRLSVQNYWRKKATKSELQQDHALLDHGSEGSYCNPHSKTSLLAVIGGTAKPVRTSLSTASLQMGSRYSNDFDGIDAKIENDGGCLAMSHTPNQSPRILITRACSEESQDCEIPLLKKTFSAATSDLQICENRRWTQPSIGSDSSTGSSDASVWTTGVKQKGRNSNKNAMDAWTIGRFVRVKTLEEGVIFIGKTRNEQNSESSENTDNTATTTSTLPSRTLTMERDRKFAEERARLAQEKKMENTEEQSESDTSWSSSEEVNEKKANLLAFTENPDTHLVDKEVENKFQNDDEA
ncbi:G-protein coupled receptor 161-like [Belonocnema kinseyi]|uniref:G-protein coupled receptor 161-like n=1 Tax=Belonocnema kinseyi TaxID=2817044 RepID=UPI00143CD58C|nr:G-protein coupled receptor 161-like [Belonocnema kinseyi]